jgi:hypothetical protein
MISWLRGETGNRERRTNVNIPREAVPSRSPDSLRASGDGTAERVSDRISRHDSDAAVPEPTWGRAFLLVHRGVIFLGISNVETAVSMKTQAALTFYTRIFT